MRAFIKNLFGQASNGEPEAGKKVNHVVVDIEITEHEYMAFDADDEMVGGESFVFNGDDSPGFNSMRMLFLTEANTLTMSHSIWKRNGTARIL